MFSKDLVWNDSNYCELIHILEEEKAGEDFKRFSERLIFTKYKMIGVKVPTLRKIAKEISKTDIDSFLSIVKSDTYEEVMIEGLVISYIKDVDINIEYFNKFIKKIDNWSICDVCISSMKIVKKERKVFFKYIKKYLKSNDEFIIRVGIILLLDYYIDDDYIDLIFELIDNINSSKYYVNMAIAWLVSVCFVKEKDKTISYLKNNNLDKFTYNKAIQKIIESKRVSLEDKNILRQMKRSV